MIDRGWAVFRREIRHFLHTGYRRRVASVGIVAAVATVVVLVVLGLTVSWPDLPSDLAGIVALALAVGVCAIAFVPLRRTGVDGSWLYWSGWQMQASDPSERYFRMRTAPTIAPGDRDAVLREGDTVLGAVVPDVLRGMVLTVGIALGCIGLALFHLVPGVLPVVLVLTAVRTLVSVHRLGRVDRAVDIASTLPAGDTAAGRGSSAGRGPSAGQPTARRRPGTTPTGRTQRSATRFGTGSKLGLPGDDD